MVKTGEFSLGKFDRVTKRAERAKATQEAKGKLAGKGKTYRSVGDEQHPGDFKPEAIRPIKINVGNSNIKVDGSSAAALGEGLKQAFKTLEDDLIWYLNQLEDWLPNDLALALEPTLALSREYCPKDTMALVNSSYLEVEKFRGSPRVEIGYGRGGDPPYAIYVHEIPATHDAPTSDKFLQRAIDEDWANVLTRITQNLKLRTGITP